MKSSILKSASVMGIAVFLSRILGLVREQVFAAMFGASHVTDAFQIAFRIPNLLRDLFAEGAMSAALVPTFVKVQTEEGRERAWQVATRVFVVLFVVVSILACVGALFAEKLVALYASAYQGVPGKFELTVRMTQMMMPFFPLVSLAAAFMAILNALGKFFMPAFASALFNVVSVLVGVVAAGLLPRFGMQPIEGMAIGVVAGGFVQALVQWPVLKKMGYRPQWKFPNTVAWQKDPAILRMMSLMIPGTVGLAATQVNILVNSVFATAVGAGAVSWLNYAFRLMQFPIGIFGVSLAQATLPVFSRAWTENDYAQAQATVRQSVRRVFAVNFPCSAGLAFLGVPIIGLIFERGQFSESDTQATALALAAYAWGLTGYSVVKVLVPICYAMGAIRVAVLSSVFSVLSNLLFNWALVDRLGFMGLAVGTSLTATLNAIILWWFISRRFSGLGYSKVDRSILGSLFAYLGLSLLMGGLVYVVDRSFLFEYHYWIRLPAGIGLGVSVFLGLSILLKMEETLDMVELFKRRLVRRN